MSNELTVAERSAISTFVAGGGGIRKVSSNGDGPPWGKVNKHRGMGAEGKYHELACAFIQAYPIGTQLTQDEFCNWAAQTLNSPEFYDWAHAHPDVCVQVPPAGTPKHSDVWHAYLSRRHRLRYNMNLAAAHPRMSESGLQAFKLESARANLLEVRLPPTALVRGGKGDSIRARLMAKRRQYDYLMQATDWTTLDVRATVRVERVYDEIERYLETSERSERYLNDACMRADEELKKIGIGVPPMALEGPDVDEVETDEDEHDED